MTKMGHGASASSEDAGDVLCLIPDAKQSVLSL